MSVLALIFTLSAIGISETAYLIRQRVASRKPVCFIGKNCAAVLESKYSRFFIIPNDLAGLFFYIFVSFLSAVLVVGSEPSGPDLRRWDITLKTVVAAGSFMSLVFTYLQWRVIRVWCFWCLMSAFTIWLMGITIAVSTVV